jgi:hypothetical protein
MLSITRNKITFKWYFIIAEYLFKDLLAFIVGFFLFALIVVCLAGFNT